MIDINIIKRTRLITRFSGSFTLHTESLGDHVLEMSLHAINIAEIMEVDSKELIYRCIVHDLAELPTADVPRALKWHNSEVAEVINDLQDSIISEYVDNDLLLSIKTSKDNSLLGKLVDILDKLQALSKMKFEKDLGNKHFNKDINRCTIIIFQLAKEIDREGRLTKYLENCLN